MMKKPIPGEQRVVLPGVSWNDFERLLVELGADRNTRLTYHRGQLEMMTPMPEHERCRKLIESLIYVVAESTYLRVATIAPILLKRPDLGCAIEPDACYYFKHAREMGDRTDIDLSQDPIPELLVEVAINKSQLNKLAIYASLGIPEVWRYITKPGDDVLKGNLLVYQLQGDEYIESKNSRVFPVLTSDRILLFIQESDSIGLVQSIQILRQWLRDEMD